MKKRYWIAGASGLTGAAIAAKILMRPRDARFEEHRDGLENAELSRFIEVDGARVHYQEAGDKGARTLMLIHGFGASNVVWANVILPLADAGFHVVAPDLIGFGFSEKPHDAEYTIEWQSRNVIRFMDELQIERATLVGSSYGGAVADFCALDFPDRVERLVLVDAVTNNEPKKQFLARLGASPVIGELATPLILSSRWIIKRRARKFYARQQLPYDDSRFESRYRIMRTASAQRAALLTLRRWDAARVESEAHKIEQPTLLVWGEDDIDIPLENARKLHRMIPNSRLIVFRNCGHVPQEEFPQEFTEVLLNFCSDRVSGKQIEVAPDSALVAAVTTERT